MPDLGADQIGLPNLTCAMAENAGAVTSVSSGTSVTAGAANVKGAWAQLIASTTKRTTFLLLQVVANAATQKFLVDIGRGAAGSEAVLIPNIQVHSNDLAVAAYAPESGFLVPINIPAGTRVAARCQSPTGGAAIRVQANLLEDPQQPSGFPLGFATPSLGSTVFESAGTNTGTSLGTTVTGGGTLNSKGAWAQLIASTAKHTVWAVVILGSTGSVVNGFLVDIGIGAAAAETVLIANIHCGGQQNNSIAFVALPIKIAAGTRIAARAQAANATSAPIAVSMILVQKD